MLYGRPISALKSNVCFLAEHLLATLVYSLRYTLFTLRSMLSALPSDDEDPECEGTSEDTVTLCWHQPRTDGALPIKDYVVQIREIGTHIWTEYVSLSDASIGAALTLYSWRG